MPVYPRRFSIFKGSENRPLRRDFRPKRLQKWSPPLGPVRPGADLGAIWRRKSSKNVFLSILKGFCLILEGFWTNFRWIFEDLQHILDVFFVRFRVELFFSKTVKPQTHEARKQNKSTNHNSANPQPIILKPWPGGMRVSD